VNRIQRAFAVASISWAGALPIATLVASRPAAASGAYLFGFAVYVIGGFVCHQRSERSFYLWTHQMPVCARCTGIYTGAALTVLALPLARRLLSVAPMFGSVARRLQTSVARTPKAFALLACAPTIATLVFEWTTGVMPSNAVRAATGLWLGGGIALLVASHTSPAT